MKEFIFSKDTGPQALTHEFFKSFTNVSGKYI